MVFLKSQIAKIDKLLLGLVLFLTLFGILMIYEASSITALRDFKDSFFYVKQQSLGFLVGLFFLFLTSKFDYRKFRKLAPFLMICSILTLILVLIPGIGIKVLGARRWMSLGLFNFQPAELTKIIFILYLSSIFSEKPRFPSFLLVSAIISLLIMLEPDLGTTVILIVSGIFLYFVAGASFLNILILGVSGILGGIFLIFLSPYRKERLLTFFDINRDPFGASYHIKQVLLSFGVGGLFGVGLGASRQKYEYLPEAMTDSIFAIIGEELGFIGCVVLIFIFLGIIYRGLKIANSAPDRFGQLLAVGISSWLGIQFLVNLASQVALIPLTGIPLPFISYGSSSLVVALTGVGILLNISKQGVKT